MTPELVQVILSAAAVILGGAFLEFLRRMLPKTRRAELRTLDAASDATLLTSANAYILTLQAGDKVLREKVEALEGVIIAKAGAWDTERLANIEALANAGRETNRCLAELARVRNDLVVAQAQIAELGARIPSRHGLRPQAGETF